MGKVLGRDSNLANDFLKNCVYFLHSFLVLTKLLSISILILNK